ncbi:MAG: hypothetical protein BWY51_00733 [Parcubacteria group bacterium ADurb.Bin316]|nr:MAG: hypothetical protein BWY51_00733 [Parcubacteria group bacterium ADurb.Bin316]
MAVASSGIAINTPPGVTAYTFGLVVILTNLVPGLTVTFLPKGKASNSLCEMVTTLEKSLYQEKYVASLGKTYLLPSAPR